MTFNYVTTGVNESVRTGTGAEVTVLLLLLMPGAAAALVRTTLRKRIFKVHLLLLLLRLIYISLPLFILCLCPLPPSHAGRSPAARPSLGRDDVSLMLPDSGHWLSACVSAHTVRTQRLPF